jgi:hypothetical protein
MIGLVEQFASQIRWGIGKTTVVVEGTSDVVFLTRAAELYAQQHNTNIFDADFAVVAAGERDDGGVDGINRRLNTVRQLADVDRDSTGALRHHFVGLFDNDAAGREALKTACRFDRRLTAYEDLFLLHPVMPLKTTGSLTNQSHILQANRQFLGLNWEIEDLCSEPLLSDFERANPGAVRSRQVISGRVHREYNRRAKPDLKRFFLQRAVLADAREMVLLLKAIRSYRGLPYAYIV